MNTAKAKALSVGEKFRGNGKGGVGPDDVFVVVAPDTDLEKHWEQFIPAVTEAEYKQGIRDETHLFLPNEMAAF